MSAPKALVLAAGHGSRLRPITDELAKPALPFVGVSILDRCLDGLADAGVAEAIINLHHAPGSIRRVVSERGPRAPRVSWSDETGQLLDTAGALMPLRERLSGGDFLLVNGDCIHALDYEAILAAHRRTGASATLAVLPRGLPEFGSLIVDDDGCVETFGAPTRGERAERHFLSVQVISPSLLDELPAGEPRPLGTFRDWFPRARERGHVFRVHETEAEWYAVDTRERYLAATRDYLARRREGPHRSSRSEVHESAQVDAGCALHGASVVGARASLRNTVLLDDARVGEDAVLVDCLVAPGVVVPAGSRREAELIGHGTGGDEHPGGA